MSTDRFPPRRGALSTSALVLIAGSGLLLFTCVLPNAGFANVLPPGNIFFNVVPATGQYDWCETDATSCEQLDPSRPEVGGFLFQIFLNPPEGYYGEPLTHLSVDLYWPDEWYLADFVFCSGGEGTLDSYGSGPHRLEITWPCTPVHYEMFPAATLGFVVTEYGVLVPDHNEQGAFQIGCPPNVDREWPFFQYAEAGTLCDHDLDPCANYNNPGCAAYFDQDELHLTGEPGQALRGQLPFTSGYSGHSDCAPAAYADDSWARARVVDGSVYWEFTLVVDADLTGMEPGTYTTNVHITSGPSWMERCILVTLDVETPSGVRSPEATNDLTDPLSLRVTGPNPSSGSFDLSYRIRDAGVVRCAVYTASGREIATILRPEEQNRGSHIVTWNGKDSRGDRVTPGVYLVRLSSNGQYRSERVVVVR